MARTSELSLEDETHFSLNQPVRALSLTVQPHLVMAQGFCLAKQGFMFEKHSVILRTKPALRMEFKAARKASVLCVIVRRLASCSRPRKLGPPLFRRGVSQSMWELQRQAVARLRCSQERRVDFEAR